MRSVLLALLVLMPSLTGQDKPEPDDRFSAEPARPRAEAPVQFDNSWEEARAESKRSGRRILAVFTGDHCGWCRVLEQRTFTDAVVVRLSEPFVRVKLNTGDETLARLVDSYQVESIPRSLVLTPAGQVVTQRTGYIPAAEYAAWLDEARTRLAAPAGVEAPAAGAPPAVGASASDADMVIWSVDASQSVKRWGDDDWTGHPQLLALLRAAGLRPRVEHMARESFPKRWDQAEAAGRVPELIVADQLAGLIRDLDRKGRLLRLLSDRLSWSPENASCPDFARRMAFVVAGGRHEDAGRKAAAEILRPGPQEALPGPKLPSAQDHDEAAAVATRAAVAFMAGDPAGLKAVASDSSPQLTRCVEPDTFRQGSDAYAESVQVRGQGDVAFARVEVQMRGKTTLGADSVLVVLHRETSRWKAFAVSSDIITVRELPSLCRLEIGGGAGSGDIPAPRRLAPENGSAIGVEGRSFAWETASGGPLAAQVCQVLLNSEAGRSWPETRIKVYPGTPRARSLLWSETAKNLTGVTAAQMSWCVWSVGRDGRIRASDVGTYRGPGSKD